MNGNHKPYLSLDWDGCVSAYGNGWQGAAVINDSPTEGMAKFLDEAVELFRVGIFSSRSNLPGGGDAMRQALLRWLTASLGEDRASHVYAQVEWPREKPPAFVGLDDRVVQFQGVWPDPRELLHFKPWNRRSGPAPFNEAAILGAYLEAARMAEKGGIVRDIFMQRQGEAVMQALVDAWPDIKFGDN
jgi:hypothetical protein